MGFSTNIIDTSIIKSKLALTPTKFYDKDDKEIGTLCRAWVNFNGTGTVEIRASFNVTSITDNGTGDYTVNFTNAMPDANYSPVFGALQPDATASNYAFGVMSPASGGAPTLMTTTNLRCIFQREDGVQTDVSLLCVSIFR